MPTHKQSYDALSLADLARLTGLNHKTIRKRLAGLPASRSDGRTLLFDPRAALPRLYALTDAQAERARLDKERADEIAMRNAVRRQELAPVQEVCDHVEEMIHAAKARLRAIPTRAAPQVIACTTPGQAHKLLLDLIDEALTELSHQFDPKRAARRAP